MLEKMATYDDVRFILETQCATNLELKYALGIIGDKVECLMHGFSNYPTEVEDLQLNSLDYFKQEFPQYTTGLADHSLDTANIPLMVLAKGCEYLEKHITLTRNNRKFDYQVSLYPHEFAVMVSNVHHYEQAMGKFMKHPTKTELPYRTVMYKKVLGNGEFKRADTGNDYLTHQFNSFAKDHVGIALIARLKSQRLPLKVLKPFHDTILVDFLYKRLSGSKRVAKTFLSTSTLAEDEPLVKVGHDNGHLVYTGHAVSVIDRMLELSLQEGFGGIFRVTGDNPFTDVDLIDEMVDLFVKQDLDYVRVNNVPFGVSAELFSTKYLWNLYLNMDNPMNSEYLTLFVLNDETAKKGCIDIISSVSDLKYINLSVDYQADYDRATALASKLEDKDLYTVNLEDLIAQIDEFEREDKNKMIKLPEGEDVKFSKFLARLENQNYAIRKQISV
jgi:spore coat polysaccharide biosynthesis protein SpsF